MKSIFIKTIVLVLFGFAFILGGDYGLRKGDFNSIDLVNEDRPVAGSRSIELVGRALHGPGQCVAINYMNTRSYTGAGGSLLIHDIADPAAPQLLGSVYTPGILSGIAYNNEICYAADGPAGFATIDVSDPSTPVIMDQLDVEGWVEEAAISGTKAYLAAGYGGIKIIDISDPNHLNLVSSMDLGGYVRDIVINGNYAYICGGDYYSQLYWWIVDISNLSVIYQKHDIFVDEYWTGVAKSGNYLYLIRVDYARERTVLEIYNVSNILHPIKCSSKYYSPGEGMDVQIKKQGVNIYAYIADGVWGFSVVNVTDPNQQVKIASLPSDYCSVIRKLSLKGNYAYTASDRIFIIDINTPANPQITGRFEVGDYACRVWGPTEEIQQDEDYCGVANCHAGLKLINVSNPYDPFLSGQIRWDAFLCEDIQLTPNYHYAYLSNQFVDDGSSSYFKVCDLQNPGLPIEVGCVEVDPALTYFSKSDNYIYANGQGLFRVIDVTQPDNPNIIGEYTWPNPGVVGMEVFADGDKAYALYKSAYNDGFYVLDINDPTNPVVDGIGVLDGTGEDLYVSGNYAYIVEDVMYINKLIIFNVSVQPPQLISELEFDGSAPWGCCIYGNFCYVAYSGGLKIANVSDPYNPYWIDTYNTPDWAVDVYCALGYIYLTVGNCGLYILKHNIEGSNPEISDATKKIIQHLKEDSYDKVMRLTIQNPALSRARITYSLPEASPVKICVYDLTGSPVRVYGLGVQGAGNHELVWDGRGRGGRCPSGVYFVRLEAGSETKTAKLVLK